MANRKRRPPKDVARWFVANGTDQEGLEDRFINPEIGTVALIYIKLVNFPIDHLQVILYSI